jgi:uncharacterized protein (DUF2147 family)
MRKLILAALSLIAPVAIAGGGVDGVWKTAVSDSGGYLLVTIGSCETNATLTCGTITEAFSKTGQDPGYEHLGKLMVWDMQSKDGTSFSNGKIWDPEKDKTYSSKMKLDGNELVVKGCIAFVCSGQTWTRAN